MNIIHSFWLSGITNLSDIPNILDNSKDLKSPNNFFQSGKLLIWVETSDKKRGKFPENHHKNSLYKTNLTDFLTKEVGIKSLNPDSFYHNKDLSNDIKTTKIILPSYDNIEPILSPLLNNYAEGNIEDKSENTDDDKIYWKIFDINTLEIKDILSFLKEINFLKFYLPRDIKIAKDLEFWIEFANIIKDILNRDQYIPSLKKDSNNNIYPYWEIISNDFDKILKQYADSMPISAVSLANIKDKLFIPNKYLILKQFCEVILHNIISNTNFTNKIYKNIQGSFLEENLNLYQKKLTNKDITDIEKHDTNLEELLTQSHQWKENIKYSDKQTLFYLCFKLNSPDISNIDNQENNQDSKNPINDWSIEMLIESKEDPSFKILLSDYWDDYSNNNNKEDDKLKKYFGSNIEENILILLGHASRIFPPLLKALDTNKPALMDLTIEEAFNFLKEDAIILQNAGYKIITPSWWLLKNKIKIKVNAKSNNSGSDISTGLFNKDSILNFKYQLAIDGEEISEDEFERLVSAKESLVNFRGKWIEIDQDQMSNMLEFFRENAKKDHQANYLDLLKSMATDQEIFEYYLDNDLEEKINNLTNPNKFNIIETSKNFNGQLRKYQARGFSWLYYLENLGLNPCLADDMGLGKTIQIISLLDYDKSSNKETKTLLIVPTSVLGNWKKEIEKFAPNLNSIIHHGTNRIKEEKEFNKIIQDNDAVITSFALIRKDHKLLKNYHWHRIVVDEAQNIKNPKSSQTKTILSLKANSKIALTGTPIENRILDLWSIMNFLNPSYLGTQSEFRRNYELPIQRDNDHIKSNILKQLVEPFILRREKTDKSIISDLPDKIEQKIFCNLTKEQASLYEATVQQVTKSLQESKENQTQAIMLSTLMKLKQICNHPSQFLKDNSEFSIDRSHKLKRLLDMCDEILENNESLLIFSQFKEIGDQLVKLFKDKLKINPYFIHGGVSSKKREQMITEFQDPNSDPGIFVLSLKAGGVGITLTKANHVFHFDRWWNPAVENQATDRAYRIGQKKKVMVHKFVTIGTLEEKIDKMIEKKKKLSDNILGTSESWLTDLDAKSFKDLIKLSKNAILE